MNIPNVAWKEGKACAEVRWDPGGTKRIKFHKIQPDKHPRRQPAVPVKSCLNKPTSDPKGPGPIELGKTGSKGKDPITCYNCSGRGHTSRQCATPKQAMSGHEAQLMEADSDDEPPGYEDAIEELSKGGT